MRAVQSAKFNAGDSVDLFQEAFRASLLITCQTSQSLLENRCFDAMRKTADGKQCCLSQKELDLIAEGELMFCGFKSVLNMIHSPMFCKIMFQYYHLRKYSPKIETLLEDGEDSENSIISTDVFKSFFKQALQFSLMKNPLNEIFSIADFERCLSVLLCNAVKGYKNEIEGELSDHYFVISDVFLSKVDGIDFGIQICITGFAKCLRQRR